MDVKTQIEVVALQCFLQAMKFSPPEDGSFKIEMVFAIDDVAIPLLIIGLTHKQYGDGRCFAILNPSKEIIESSCPDSYFEKYMVKGKCDLLSCQWVNTNGMYPEVTGGFSYVSRKRMNGALYASSTVEA